MADTVFAVPFDAFTFFSFMLESETERKTQRKIEQLIMYIVKNKSLEMSEYDPFLKTVPHSENR